MKKIELKAICDDVEITLNNLRNCEIVESDGSVAVVFGNSGLTLKELEPEVNGKPDDCDGNESD